MKKLWNATDPEAGWIKLFPEEPVLEKNEQGRSRWAGYFLAVFPPGKVSGIMSLGNLAPPPGHKAPCYLLGEAEYLELLRAAGKEVPEDA